MTGPEHYLEAERLLATCEEYAERHGWDKVAPESLAAVQAHATLALTAATVDQIAARGPGDVDLDCRAVTC